ncbi:TetR/AcrR family transcriptional regulator [Paenibacillus wynnii]|uniref:TetR/AcrR family transcriptional regulator n=1 Tax=Paenibacillus wynnii TaxID=268407 RepID=UPI0027907105|nr:TetR/AcrR family transcriptional regulator [Paenibacillus wynnii]MDQ0195022.1 AcrR family transcriptional regulator [Paenibacillus wynnii]
MSPRVGLDTKTIVSAAAQIADEFGIEEVTLAALAAKLGVRSPSLYNHISGLQSLRTQLAIYGLEQLYEMMSEAAKGANGSTAVHAMGLAYVNFSRSHPGLYETTLRAPEGQNAELAAISDKILSLIILVLQVYHLGEEGTIHAVRGLRSILHGFASLEHKGGFGMPLDSNVSLSRLIDTFIAGIGRMNSEGE